MPWSTKFSEPIVLSNGDKLTTLQEAGAYITHLPKAAHDDAPWQNAMHVLIQAADHDGPIEFARLAMLQALFPKGTPVYRAVDKDSQWRNNRNLARDS